MDNIIKIYNYYNMYKYKNYQSKYLFYKKLYLNQISYGKMSEAKLENLIFNLVNQGIKLEKFN